MKKQLSVFALHTRAAIGRLALVVLTGLMLLVLPVRFGSGRTAGILQSAAALFAACICGYLGFLQAHNGKEGPEDELD